MKFEVSWVPSAEEDLADIYLNLPNKDDVVAASKAIDRYLALDPLDFGESRQSSVERVGQVSPIGISYEVIVDDHKVFVTRAWLVK